MELEFRIDCVTLEGVSLPPVQRAAFSSQFAEELELRIVADPPVAGRLAAPARLVRRLLVVPADDEGHLARHLAAAVHATLAPSDVSPDQAGTVAR